MTMNDQMSDNLTYNERKGATEESLLNEAEMIRYS